MAGNHIVQPKTYAMVFGGLVILMVLTVAASYVHIPFTGGNIILAMAIAILKAVLIVLFFMHVKYSSKLIWVFASAGFLFLMILVGLTMNDYIGRTDIFPGMRMTPIVSEYLSLKH
jgi:cytochrome c oxidase subunit 4